MKRFVRALLLAVVLLAARGGGSWSQTLPSEPPVETERNTALRVVYFPFLALGHGVVLIAQYGILYPIYYVFKPVYDTLYESSEDPHELGRSGSEAGATPEARPR